VYIWMMGDTVCPRDCALGDIADEATRGEGVDGGGGDEGEVEEGDQERVTSVDRHSGWVNEWKGVRSTNIDGIFLTMLIPSEAGTARSAGRAAEKTNEVPLMRCGR